MTFHSYLLAGHIYFLILSSAFPDTLSFFPLVSRSTAEELLEPVLPSLNPGTTPQEWKDLALLGVFYSKGRVSQIVDSSFCLLSGMRVSGLALYSFFFFSFRVIVHLCSVHSAIPV